LVFIILGSEVSNGHVLKSKNNFAKWLAVTRHKSQSTGLTLTIGAEDKQIS